MSANNSINYLYNCPRCHSPVDTGFVIEEGDKFSQDIPVGGSLSTTIRNVPFGKWITDGLGVCYTCGADTEAWIEFDGPVVKNVASIRELNYDRLYAFEAVFAALDSMAGQYDHDALTITISSYGPSRGARIFFQWSDDLIDDSLVGFCDGKIVMSVLTSSKSGFVQGALLSYKLLEFSQSASVELHFAYPGEKTDGDEREYLKLTFTQNSILILEITSEVAGYQHYDLRRYNG